MGVIFLVMLEHIPAGVNPSGHKAQLRIENNQDALQLHAADEYAAFIEGVASYMKLIIHKFEDVRNTDISYKIESEEFGQGALLFAIPEEAPALPDLFNQLVEPFYGDDYVELRAEGYDISPDYGMPESDYKYVFHYGN